MDGVTCRKKILIAEDEIVIAKLVRILLERKGYEVFTASDGAEALRLAFNEEPDLLILDLMMPKMTGEEVCRELRKDDQFDGMPVIMLTAKSGDADRVIGRVLGADEYMTKPFEGSELLGKIEELLTR
jgi:DNA-binding response OmpR family regulator